MIYRYTLSIRLHLQVKTTAELYVFLIKILLGPDEVTQASRLSLVIGFSLFVCRCATAEE